MPTIVFQFSCSAMFSKKEFAIVSYLIFISMKNSCSAELSMKKFYNRGARPQVIKLFRAQQLSMKSVLLTNLKLQLIANSFLLNIAEHENSRMKMPIIIGVFILISRENFMLS